ncbi:MAG: PEP-CTERM sorting domain-containing protein [Deltaproteobacteria bacterium]|nr:PEP-CTERM sorting domain-containing protein [Deltaproteobacteria bacterium]
MRPTAIFALALWLAPVGPASAHLGTPSAIPAAGPSIVLEARDSEISRLARTLELPIGPPSGLFPRAAEPPSFELPLFDSALFDFLSDRHGWDSPPPRAIAGRPPTPEPSTALLLGLGLAGLAWAHRERRER